jgi:hypothetical protein
MDQGVQLGHGFMKTFVRQVIYGLVQEVGFGLAPKQTDLF